MKKLIITGLSIVLLIVFIISTIVFLKFKSKEKILNQNDENISLEEKDEEEQYKFLNTMTEEEKYAIINNKEDREKLVNKELYSYQLNEFVYSLKELRFVEKYIKENHPNLEVVFEGVLLNSRDNSLLSNKGSDEVIVHLKSDTKKYPTQYIIALKEDENGNYIVVRDNLNNNIN